GINEDLNTKPPCHPRAARGTDCLTRNGYKEERCQPVILALYECCEAFYRSRGDDAISASCPKPNLLHLKLRRMREESQSKK
ncbi:Cx9C motif-containing protein 4, mitochondrial, partial [Colletotrichum chlorophyti]